MRSVLCAAAALLLLVPAVRAQDPPPPTPLIKNLLARVAKPAPAGTNTLTFKPSGKRMILDTYINSVSEKEDERKMFRDALEKLMTAYEGEAKKAGFANDIAASTTFALSRCWTLWKGEEVSDAAGDALLKQLRGALDTPEMKKLSDADKQKLYETTLYGVLTLEFLHAVAENQKDEDTKKSVATAAKDQLQHLLGVSPETIRITDKGLEAAAKEAETPPAKETEPPVAKATGVSLDTVLASYKLPEGWETKKYGESAVISHAIVADKDGRRHNCEIRLLAPRPAPNGAAPVFQQLWKETFADFKAGEVSISYRRVFPCGAVGHYMGGIYSPKNNDTKMYVAVYVLDLGNVALPFVLSVLPGRAQFDYNPMQFGYETLVQYAAPFVDSLKLKKAAPVRPTLFSPAEVQGYWTESSSSMVVGGYYVTANGSYAGEMMSAYGMTMHLNPDKTFYYHFVYSNRGGREVGQDLNEGTFALANDLLKLNPRLPRTYKYWYKVVGAGFIGTDKGNKRALVLRGSDSAGNFELPPYFPQGKEWQGSVSWLTETDNKKRIPVR